MNDDAERTGGGEHVKHARVARLEQHPKRVVVRGEVAAEAVVQRDRIERLLVQRLARPVSSVTGRSSRVATPAGAGRAGGAASTVKVRGHPSSSRPAAAIATTIRRVRPSRRFTASAATTLRQASAIIQKRAGTRSPSKPGSRISSPYGALRERAAVP